MSRGLLYRYWVIQHLYDQQYVRPIIRGKQNKPVEFGAKLSVSLDGDGFAQVDHLRWDAFHEGLDLKSQVEVYRCQPWRANARA
ncbi:hypothetical protein BMR08_17435, partial [Methylococcaceae bacterium CS2]